MQFPPRIDLESVIAGLGATAIDPSITGRWGYHHPTMNLATHPTRRHPSSHHHDSPTEAAILDK